MTQKRKTAAEKKAEQTEQKQALGVLHRIYWEYVALVRRDDHFYQEAFDAFHTLTRTIHGEPALNEHGTLCDVCHEAYYTFWVHIPDSDAIFPERHDTSILDCCTACKERLLHEGKLLKVNGQSVQPQESEVQV